MDEPLPLCGVIADKTHELKVRVYYADTDFSGHVYHGRYLEFFERGRSELLRLCNVHHHELFGDDKETRLAWVVRKMTIDFVKPARIDDLLTVATQVIALSGARLTLKQVILKSDASIIAEAAVHLALINGFGKPRRLKPDWLNLFSAMIVNDATKLDHSPI